MSQTIEDVAQGQLRSYVERLERLEEEKGEVSDGIKDVLSEAKGSGFDTKAIKAILKLRKEDPDARDAFNQTVDLYAKALGMDFQPRLPFGDEGVRVRSARDTAGGNIKLQICDADGKPLHPPADPELVRQALQEVQGMMTEDAGEEGAPALYDQAIAAVRSSGRASANFLRRELIIGAERTKILIDRMERDGVISAADGENKRTVLPVPKPLPDPAPRMSRDDLADEALRAERAKGPVYS